MQQSMHENNIPLVGPIKKLHTHVPSDFFKTIATTEVYARKGELNGLEDVDVKFLHDILLQDDIPVIFKIKTNDNKIAFELTQNGVKSKTQLCLENFKPCIDDFENSLAILQKNSLTEEEHCILAELKHHVLKAI